MSAFVTSSPLGIRSLKKKKKNVYLSPESQIKQHTDISGLIVPALNKLNQTMRMEIAWTFFSSAVNLEGYKTTDAASAFPPWLPL